MHLHFEKNTNTKCDCSILSLSWMGKVPDDIPEDEGWKLNRTNYYQEGWLATGNIRGIVGVTFTTSHCKKNFEYPSRTNYNLRGHRSDVILVKWNEPYQKLASCDSSGIIFVWIKYEGRWSIELINDRNTPVTYFSWSHDGRMALICYQDGFVLVGSVAGQRYWSSMLNLESTITCGMWTPDDQQVYFSTTQGQLIVMDVHGAMVSQVQLCTDVGITSMSWSCEKFKMEEGDDMEPGVANASNRIFVLAISLKNGYIYLIKSYDDVSPIQINTELNGSIGIVMEWSNSRELLAVAGTLSIANESLDDRRFYPNYVKFYTETGMLLYSTRIPDTQSMVTALTWGHNDKRLFIATGTQVHIAWISRRVASLQLLCRLEIQSRIGSEGSLLKLPLPSRIRSLIGNLFAQTIRCCVPNGKSIREFVSRPPVCSTRLHCTMIRHDDETNINSGSCYTLYLEYLGGLVPLLKGKRTSKIRPEFVIFDPQDNESSIFIRFTDDTVKHATDFQIDSIETQPKKSDSSDSEAEESLKDGRPKRKPATKRSSKPCPTPQSARLIKNSNELSYIDTLPEVEKLVELTSNIWGTKFKIHGLAKTVPANLGQVTYKTSLLHLQPRQMTLVITELRDDFFIDPDPNFNPNIFSEDEDDSTGPFVDRTEKLTATRKTDPAPPIAPMSPQPTRFANRSRPQPFGQFKNDRFDTTPSDSFRTKEMPIRPKQIDTTASTSRSTGQNYLVCQQYGRSNGSMSSSGNGVQSRHAISPLCCEGSVPTLQSPKNAVAPSDIIFERPPTVQSAAQLMTYTTSTVDYSMNSLVPIKHTILSTNDTFSTNSYSHSYHPTPQSIAHPNSSTNSKHLEIVAAVVNHSADNDEETSSTSVSNKSDMESASTSEQKNCQIPMITTTSASNAITRSCSVGFLDSFEIAPSDMALSMLRKETPNKRLVLFDRKPIKERKQKSEALRKLQLQQCGKSKSLDSCLYSLAPEQSKPLGNILSIAQTPKCSDESDNEVSSLSDINETIEKAPEPKIQSIQPSKLNCTICHGPLSAINFCTLCKTFQTKSKLSTFITSSADRFTLHKPLPNKKKSEIITSYADSPLFTRKHRFGNGGSEPMPAEILLKDERRKKKDDLNGILDDATGKDQPMFGSLGKYKTFSLQSQALQTLENIISRLRDLDDNGRSSGSYSPQKNLHTPRSSPASPAPSKKSKRNHSSSPIRQILNSPLLNRRQRKKSTPENHFEGESTTRFDTVTNGSGNRHQYSDLETFQKSQLRQKLKRSKIEPNGPSLNSMNNEPSPLRREFVMHNKAPMWNENSQVYQLDFGGRVTQESAKNFQIEFRGKQVMQFGRIDSNAYTLDFQYPFSALQAFSVALANVTQRLK